MRFFKNCFVVIVFFLFVLGFFLPNSAHADWEADTTPSNGRATVYCNGVYLDQWGTCPSNTATVTVFCNDGCASLYYKTVEPSSVACDTDLTTYTRIDDGVPADEDGAFGQVKQTLGITNGSNTQKVCVMSVDVAGNIEMPSGGGFGDDWVDIKFVYSISGNIFLDNDGNGVWGGGVPEGIYPGSISGSISTNYSLTVPTYPANGQYNIEGFPEGTYTVGFIIPTGYVATNGDSCTSDCVGDGTTEKVYKNVTLSWVQSDMVVDFGIRQLTISGTVFQDIVAENGSRDVGEPVYTALATTNISVSPALPPGSISITSPGEYRISNITTGTYTVTLTIPTGYIATYGELLANCKPPNETSCVSTPTQTRTTSRDVVVGTASRTGIDFGISKLYSVGGNINDATGSDCSSAVPYALGRDMTIIRNNHPSVFPSTDNYVDSKVPPSPLTSSYLFTSASPYDDYLRQDRHTLSFSGASGYRVKSVTSSSPLASDTRSYAGLNFDLVADRTINFCVQLIEPWFQTTTGDVRKPQIRETLPDATFKVSADINYPSIFFSSASDAVGVPNRSIFSAKNWIVDSEYSYNNDFEAAKGVTSYTFYRSRAIQLGITPEALPCAGTICSIPALPVGAGLPDVKMYEAPSGTDVTINSYSHGAGTRVIILSDSNVTINTTIDVPSGSLFILAARGNINIASTVGAPSHSTDVDISGNPITQLDGIFTAEGNINIQGGGISGCETNPAGDKRLNVEGTLIANADYPFRIAGTSGISDPVRGIVSNSRSLCNDDFLYPTFKIYPRYDFVTQLTDFYKDKESKWEEIEP